MGRVSTRQNKNIYQRTREELGLTREKAEELLESVTAERIEKIESEKSLPYPDEVLQMAEKYKTPILCNYYCANQCPIGQQYVPEVKSKDLSQIILELLASLNAVSKQKDRLIEITADGEGNSATLLSDIVNGTTQVTEGISAGMGIDIKSLIMGALGGKLAADPAPWWWSLPQPPSRSGMNLQTKPNELLLVHTNP